MLSCLAFSSQGDGLFVGSGRRIRQLVLGVTATSDSSSLASSNPSLVVDEDNISCEVASSDIVRSYLDSTPNSRLEDFHIQGWRWHMQSLVRESDRLHKLASRTNINTAQNLKDASDYVVGFNLRGLHKIEAGLFFPWMKEKLTLSAPRTDLKAAFASMMDQLESDRRMVAKLGDSISQNMILACDLNKPETLRLGAIDAVTDQSNRLHNYAKNMMEIENTYLVPAIAELVSEDEQKAFNNKVLLNLGLLDSRLHLVGMHEAVWETNDLTEKELFRQAIPSIPQLLIPRWKRTLYNPRTSMLD